MVIFFNYDLSTDIIFEKIGAEAATPFSADQSGSRIKRPPLAPARTPRKEHIFEDSYYYKLYNSDQLSSRPQRMMGEDLRYMCPSLHPRECPHAQREGVVIPGKRSSFTARVYFLISTPFARGIRFILFWRGGGGGGARRRR